MYSVYLTKIANYKIAMLPKVYIPHRLWTLNGHYPLTL
jgi:hypothetical protein